MVKRETKRLSPRGVETISTPGRHADGDGLYLVVDKSGARRWVFLFRWRGKLKEMGLGGFSTVGLAKARDKAEAARKLLGDGVNPIEAAQEERAVPTFGKMAEDLIVSLAPQWRSAKHGKQWSATLDTHAADLKDKLVTDITTEHVLKVLQKIWASHPETASRLRGRIERVLDAAKARGYIRSPWENPARWRGHLDHLLPKRGKLTRGHHAAMPFDQVPAFVADLREREAMAARALEFAILTAARSGEVLGATWAEVSIDKALWVVPAKRMKAGLEHRVPLSPRAVMLLRELAEVRDPKSPYVFPGQKRGRPLSSMAMEMMLRRMKRDDATVHGFRSSFRDWTGEKTSFPRELAEMSLAHAVGDEVERAYRRQDALERRRKLMESWAMYCQGDKAGGNVKRFERRA